MSGNRAAVVDGLHGASIFKVLERRAGTAELRRAALVQRADEIHVRQGDAAQAYREMGTSCGELLYLSADLVVPSACAGLVNAVGYGLIVAANTGRHVGRHLAGRRSAVPPGVGRRRLGGEQFAVCTLWCRDTALVRGVLRHRCCTAPCAPGLSCSRDISRTLRGLQQNSSAGGVLVMGELPLKSFDLLCEVVDPVLVGQYPWGRKHVVKNSVSCVLLGSLMQFSLSRCMRCAAGESPERGLCAPSRCPIRLCPSGTCARTA